LAKFSQSGKSNRAVRRRYAERYLSQEDRYRYGTCCAIILKLLYAQSPDAASRKAEISVIIFQNFEFG